MAHFLIQGSSTAATWGAMMKNPHDQEKLVRPTVEAAGGRLEALYFAFGPRDFYAIVEMPDSTSGAALGIAAAASGAFSSFETVCLLTTGEATNAMQVAAGMHYPRG